MFKKAITFLLSAMLVFSLVIIPASIEVNADGSPNYVGFSDNVTVYKFAASSKNYYALDLGKKGANAKKITASASKKGIITEIDSYDGSVAFRAKKAGKTVLTIKVTKKSGTVKKYKVKVNVKKYISPIKSLKIGKSSYTKKLGNKTDLAFKISGKKAKFSIKLKKGWKISNLEYYAMYDGDDENLSDIDKTYKNNAVISFQKSEDYSEYVCFTLTNKDNGIKVAYELELGK